MSLKKAVVSMFVGGLVAGAAASASAQTVESAKAAPQYSLLPNFHGSIDLRSYQFRELNEKTGDNRLPRIASRTYLGSTFMDGKLDITAILQASAKPQSEKLNERTPQLDIKYTAIDTTYFELDPILTMYTAKGGEPGQAYPDLYAELRYPAELSIGKWTTSLSGEWNVKLVTEQTDASVETQGRSAKDLGLAEKDGEPVRPKQDLDAAAQYVLASNLTSGKWSLTLYQFLDQIYNPRYVAAEDGSVEVSRPVQTSVTEGIKVGYKITDRTTISNEAYWQQGGVYETQFDGADSNKGLYSFSNIAKVAYRL